MSTTEIRQLLGISEYAPLFRGVVQTDPHHMFHDTVCDDCACPGAVYVEYTVYDSVEGYIATDAMFCASHAPAAVRCVLDREDRSHDHDTTVNVNHWAIQYGAFREHAA